MKDVKIDHHRSRQGDPSLRINPPKRPQTQPAASETSEHAEPVNDNYQSLSMNGNETHQNPSLTDNDNAQFVA